MFYFLMFSICRMFVFKKLKITEQHMLGVKGSVEKGNLEEQCNLSLKC